jgi:hypothetical protein
VLVFLRSISLSFEGPGLIDLRCLPSTEQWRFLNGAVGHDGQDSIVSATVFALEFDVIVTAEPQVVKCLPEIWLKVEPLI